MNAAILQSLLLAFLAASYALSLVYLLRRRRMPAWAYLGWGLFALLIPALGPFITIAFQPGRSVSGRPRRVRRRPSMLHQ
jgi:hypothetical protein